MSGGRILVVDDDAAIRTVVGEALRRAGHDVALAETAKEREELLISYKPDLLITDVVLPDGDGLDLVPSILARFPGLPVIVISAQNTLSTAVRATEKGAFEYLPKPFDLDDLCGAVTEGLLRRGNAGLGADSGKAYDNEEGNLPLVGRSAAMQDVYRTIARVVSNDLGVLILGESGTGKELVARAIHDMGARKSGPFVAVNMAAIPRELIEAELFGHERGAFTGAATRVAGRFEQAARGTLFLDEIGDMPMEAQTRLLRVLQSGEFTTVGGNRLIKANVRIVAATNKNLSILVESGAFREDLYYRLNIIPVDLPPLRNRGDDIALLARHFLSKAMQEGLPSKRLAVAAEDRLRLYEWPGNVRELENLMRRLAVLARDELISADLIDQQIQQTSLTPLQIPPRILSDNASDSLSLTVQQHLDNYFTRFGSDLPPDGLYHRILVAVERPLIRQVMISTSGNQIKAARLLGVNRNTLRKKLSDLDIDPSLGRGGKT
jgi:two-component system, NtrC family, nitrogen regulation response regulator GlnG